jgi:hypothetical protein
MQSLRQQLIILLFFSFVLGVFNGCKSSGPYNPYLNAKTKPSEQQAKETNKLRKQQNRAIKKQAQSSRKTLFGRKTAPKQ